MTCLRLRHGRIDLALHVLREAPGPRLLCLHELGGSSDSEPASELRGWPGSVYSLDFTGHGDSTVPRGGGYTAEILLADADAALAELGQATVVGRGIGGYVALLLAGSRPRQVWGAVVCDGRGLEGGGERGSPPDVAFASDSQAPPDPYALHELSCDARPSGYARLFARQARHLSEVADPITVSARERPPWLAAVVESEGVRTGTVGEALERYLSFVPDPCVGG